MVLPLQVAPAPTPIQLLELLPQQALHLAQLLLTAPELLEHQVQAR